MDSTRSEILLARPDGIVIASVPGTDPLLLRVRDLCYETLHRPFGVTRNDSWNEADPASTHLVAMDGERLAGYARMFAGPGGGQIRQVVVAPEYRRRRIASDLVSYAVARAATLGLPMAYLHARRHAVLMYERLGFHVVGGPFRMGRTYLPHVRMERRLP